MKITDTVSCFEAGFDQAKVGGLMAIGNVSAQEKNAALTDGFLFAPFSTEISNVCFPSIFILLIIYIYIFL